MSRPLDPVAWEAGVPRPQEVARARTATRATRGALRDSLPMTPPYGRVCLVQKWSGITTCSSITTQVPSSLWLKRYWARTSPLPSTQPQVLEVFLALAHFEEAMAWARTR